MLWGNKNHAQPPHETLVHPTVPQSVLLALHQVRAISSYHSPCKITSKYRSIRVFVSFASCASSKHKNLFTFLTLEAFSERWPSMIRCFSDRMALRLSPSALPGEIYDYLDCNQRSQLHISRWNLARAPISFRYFAINEVISFRSLTCLWSPLGTWMILPRHAESPDALSGSSSQNLTMKDCRRNSRVLVKCS
jgi:hypothetical protein